MTYPFGADAGRHRAELGFLLDDFCGELRDVSYAIAVSGDGIPLAVSSGVDPAVRDQLAAGTSGLMSLTGGMAQFMQAGQVNNILVDLDLGWVIVRKPSHRVVLTVLASPHAELGQIQHELIRLGESVGAVLDPGARPPAPTVLR